MSNNTKRKILHYSIFFIVAAICVTLTSCVSILYYNHKMPVCTDLFTYLDIGNAINHGKVLYTDIVDTKGPLFLYYFAILLKCKINPFLFTYISEIIVAFFYSVLQYKIAKLHTDNHKICIASSIIACVFYHVLMLTFLGGTFEEFAILIITYIFYRVEQSISIKKPLSNSNLIIIGILCSIIYLSKFSILIFVIPIGIYYLYYNRTNIAKTIIIFIIGFIAIVTPVFGYLMYKGNLTEYFYYQFSANLTRVTTYPKFDLYNLFYGYIIPISIMGITFKRSFRYSILTLSPIIITFLLLHIPIGELPYQYYLAPVYYACSIFISNFLMVLSDKNKTLTTSALGVGISAMTSMLVILGLLVIVIKKNSDCNYVDTIISATDELNSTDIYCDPTDNLGINYYYDNVPGYKHYNNGLTTQEQIDEAMAIIQNKQYKYIVSEEKSKFHTIINKYYTVYNEIPNTAYTIYQRKN